MTAPPSRMRLWQDLNREEIADHREAGAMVVVPVGAIEQHGNHLPVETDARLSTLISWRAARRVTDVPLLVAPSLPFGFSPHHLSHPGTISLRLGTYLAVIGDIVSSIAESGFRRIVLVNGHGGNSAPLRAKVAELVTDGYPVAAVDYWAPGEQRWVAQLLGELKRFGHGCEFETALMLALADSETEAGRIAAAAKSLEPRTIQPWIAANHASDPITEAGASWPPIFQADDQGYYGDPGAATRENGLSMLETVTDRLAKFFSDFAAAPLRIGIARDARRPSILQPLKG